MKKNKEDNKEVSQLRIKAGQKRGELKKMMGRCPIAVIITLQPKNGRKQQKHKHRRMKDEETKAPLASEKRK